MNTLRSRLGFGGWGLGGKASGILGYGPIDVEKTIKLIGQAIDKSITFFDTSPAYGDGMSENILGQATEGKRKSIFLASKIGTTNFRESQNFHLPQLRHSLDETLIRLKTDYLDLMQLHDPESPSELPGVLEFMIESKAKGLIKNIGVSLKNPLDFDIWAQFTEIDYFQLNFSALDQRLLSTSVARAAQIRGVKIISRTSLCFGFLTDEPPKREDLDETDHRKRWSDKQFKNWVIASNSVFDGVSVNSKTEGAIRFCLSFPWIHVVLIGMMNNSELESNLEIESKGPLSAADVEKIIENYSKASVHIPKIGINRGD